MSSGPFLCYKELVPSTCVLCSEFFRTDGQDFLMTSSSTTLNVYRIQHASRNIDHSKLQQVATFNICGFPRDICSVDLVRGPTGKQQKTQHLLISLDQGKIVLVAFETMGNTLKVLKMFNAEDGAIGESACSRSDVTPRIVYPGLGSNPFLSVDAQSGVACMSINAYELFFLAYRNSKIPQKHFTVHIPSFGLPGAILDMCFVSGYSHPTLAIIQDTLSLPIGHAVKVAHTVTLTVLAVNFATQSCVPLWQQKKLPHNSCRLVSMSPCRAVSSGVMVITLNAALIATQEGVFGIATNGFAKATVSDHISLVAWPLSTGAELHASRWKEISPGSFVASLLDGTLLLLRLESTAVDAVSGQSSVYYDIDIIGKSIEATCFSVLPVASSSTSTASASNTKRMVWFMGSSVADCLLMDVVMTSRAVHHRNRSNHLHHHHHHHHHHRDSKMDFTVSYKMDDADSSSIYLTGDSNIGTPTTTVPPSKRLRQTPNNSMDIIAESGQESVLESAHAKALKEEALFYENESTNELDDAWSYPEFSIKVADSITVLGPILSGSFFTGNEEALCAMKSISWDRSMHKNDSKGKGKHSAAAYITDREARDTLEVAAGVQGRASLLRVSKGIHLSKLAARNFTHVTESCTLPYEYTSPLNSSIMKGTFFFFSETQGVTSGNRNRGYGSSQRTIKESSKIVLATEKISEEERGVQMEELQGEGNAFCTEQHTISVGLVQSDIIVQTCSQCLRVVQVSPSGADDSVTLPTFSLDMMALQDVVVEEAVDMGGFGGGAGRFMTCLHSFCIYSLCFIYILS